VDAADRVAVRPAGAAVQIMQLLEAKVTGKRPKPVKALPGPRTLVEEARDAVRRERIDDLKYAFGYRR